MRNLRSLTVYTIVHMLVDFVCFYMLFSVFKLYAGVDLRELALGFLIYNALAFGLQPLFGYIYDKVCKLPIAAIGCLFITVAVWLSNSPWLMLALLGVGNACFHIGGGADSLVRANGRVSRSGIFVSSGALGVALGSVAGTNMWFGTALAGSMVPAALAGLSGIAVLILCPDHIKKDYHAKSLKTANKSSSSLLVIGLCTLAIVIRSFVGATIPTDWAKTTDMLILMLMPSIAAFVGKIVGGFLADAFGAKFVSIVSLLLSALLLCLFSDIPLLCTIGIILFNVPMSVTLCGIASKMPQRPGLSFGLSTLAILAGVIPTYIFTTGGSAWYSVVMAALIVAAAFCIRYAISDRKNKPSDKDTIQKDEFEKAETCELSSGENEAITL